MEKSRFKERINHVLKAISNIREFIKDSSPEEFVEDAKLQSAVLYQFMIIGEAIGHMDQSILEKYEYAWHIPKSFRNYIVHSYHGIKLERIYYAANDLKILEEVMQLVLKNEF